MESSVDFLKQEFLRRRERNPAFSLRAFAKWLELSPAQVSQILSGKRTLTLKSAKKIAKRLDLSPKEKVRFLSRMNTDVLRAIDEEENARKDRLRLEEDQFRTISDWHHFAILSLTKLPGAKADPRWISRRVGISVEEARSALDRLERLGILQTKPAFRQIGAPIAVETVDVSAAVRRYHAQNLRIAEESLDRVPKSLRNFQSITFPADPALVEKCAPAIDRFLSEISEFLEEGKTSEVYTLAVQLFPATRSSEKSS